MIITVSNYTNNVGKTFIATELAKRLASCGYETLLMDFGSSCANYFDVELIECQDVYEFLTTEAELEDLIQETEIYGLSLLRGSYRIKNLKPSMYKRFNSTNRLINRFEKVKNYECVVIDTMPKNSVLSVIHRLSDFIVIPINGYHSSIEASKEIISDLQTYENLGWDGEYGVLLNNMEISDIEPDYEVVNNLPIMPMDIFTYGQGSTLYNPVYSAAEENLKSVEFNDVIDWIFMQLGEIFYAD